MKLQKCPHCGEALKASKLVYLSGFNSEECDLCKGRFKLDSAKSIPYATLIALPTLASIWITALPSYLHYILILSWLLLSSFYYLKHVPLIKDDV